MENFKKEVIGSILEEFKELTAKKKICTYNDLSDAEAVDAIVEEVLAGKMINGRCDAGWAMFARLSGLREEIVGLRKEIKKLKGE